MAPGSLYGSDYSKESLDKLSEFVSNYFGEVYCYFNNDSEGFAVKDALYLKDKLN